MKRTIKLLKIRWGNTFQVYRDNNPVYPDVDGAVEYEITILRSDEEIAEARSRGIEYLNPWVFTVFQPFKLLRV